MPGAVRGWRVWWYDRIPVSVLQYLRLFEANREVIKGPDLIYPGQIFDLPN